VAAKNGHDSVVERLLEAQAAVDEKDSEGRGLGRGFKGKSLMRHGIVVRKKMKCGWFNFLGGCCFQFFWKACQKKCISIFCCVLKSGLYRFLLLDLFLEIGF